jgi:hypothetical protein
MNITGYCVFYPSVDSEVKHQLFTDENEAKKFHDQYVPGHATLVPVIGVIPAEELSKDTSPMRTPAQLAHQSALNVIKSQGEDFDRQYVLENLESINNDTKNHTPTERLNMIQDIFAALDKVW